MAANLPALLIDQWQQAPRMRAIADTIATVRDEALTACDRIETMLNPNTAEGVWLDYLAARIGLVRPSITNPSADPRFGFDSAGQPFDQAPFEGSVANAARFPMPDGVFRRLIAARAIALMSDGTFGPLRRSILAVDPAATVTDNRNMTIAVTTGEQTLLKLADEAGALARNAAVRLVYS